MRCSKPRARTPDSRCARPAIRCWPTFIASRIWRAASNCRAAFRSADSWRSWRRKPEKAESAEAPVLEEGAEGVRLMTVHAAKGLEFPVVILADMTANIAAGDPDRYVDARQRLCATRLLRCAPWELREHEARGTVARTRRRSSSGLCGGDARARSAGGSEPWAMKSWTAG